MPQFTPAELIVALLAVAALVSYMRWDRRRLLSQIAELRGDLAAVRTESGEMRAMLAARATAEDFARDIAAGHPTVDGAALPAPRDRRRHLTVAPPLAWIAAAATALATWYRRHHVLTRVGLAGAAAGVIAALIVWTLLPDTGVHPPPPDRTAPTPAVPAPPTPTPSVEQTSAPPIDGSPPAAPIPPPGQPTPGDRPTAGTPPPRSPPETTPPGENGRQRCLRLHPIVVRPNVCLDRIGELLPVAMHVPAR